MSLLEMRGINKSFSGVQVLHDVELTVEVGEVHALLGENGAGKSTLMNVLTGVFPMDSGEVTFDGHALENATIKKTEEIGIAFVHQELNLFNDLTVYENIFLNKEYTGAFGRCRKKEMIAKTEELFASLGVEIDPVEKVENLSTARKQLLEISKALFFEAKLLILDEPTTALNTEEVEHLFKIVNNLKKEGKSFIFISHKMPEIFEIADSYTVFRNGRYIGSGKIADTDSETVTRLMVGDSYSNEDLYKEREAGETVLEFENYSGEGFHDVSFSVKKGQIIGLTGLQGSGSSELLQGIFGTAFAHEGKLTVKGRELTHHHSTHDAMKAGLALLPSNRKENSVIPDMSLLENMYLAEQTLSGKRFHINKKEESGRMEKYRKMLNIKMDSENDPITALSGGNQQKVFIARWLNTNADILLFDNPTQGIDVGAKAEIYKLILQLAESGKTILINTLEIPELRKIADECLVFYEGSIIKALPHDEITEEKVMMYSTNAVNA